MSQTLSWTSIVALASSVLEGWRPTARFRIPFLVVLGDRAWTLTGYSTAVLAATTVVPAGFPGPAVWGPKVCARVNQGGWGPGGGPSAGIPPFLWRHFPAGQGLFLGVVGVPFLKVVCSEIENSCIWDPCFCAIFRGF